MSANEKSLSRRKEYKRALDIEDTRRKREESTFLVRKKQREEQLQKRRNLLGLSESQQEIENDYTPNSDLDELKSATQDLFSENPNAYYAATVTIRKLLSVEVDPPIDEAVEAGVVPRLVQFLTFHNSPTLQFEAAWALTNIASGESESTKLIVAAGGIPHLCNLLMSPDTLVQEQAVWALGNVAGDCPDYRDQILSIGVLPVLIRMIKTSPKISMQRNAVWTVSNLCRGKPAPPFIAIQDAIPVLSSLIRAEDEQVVIDACWAVSYVSDGDPERIQSVLANNIAPRIIELLLHPNSLVQTPALRVIGNIVTGNDQQTQYMISLGVLPQIANILARTNKRAIKKEACWTVSNITAGPPEQIQQVLDARLAEQLVHHMAHSELDVQKEAAWAVANATSSGNQAQIRYIGELGAIPPMLRLLRCDDTKLVAVTLEAIDNFIKSAASTFPNPFIRQLIDNDGTRIIEDLTHHKSSHVYFKAEQLYKKYLVSDDHGMEVAPGATSFQFQRPSTGDAFQF